MSNSNASVLRREMEDLMREAGQERQMNGKTLQAMEEQPVVVQFGAVVQLQHVRSGAYLTVRNEQAELNKVSLKLEVDASGSASSFFRLMPRFKVPSPPPLLRDGALQ
jgi:hypothetical protein